MIKGFGKFSLNFVQTSELEFKAYLFLPLDWIHSMSPDYTLDSNNLHISKSIIEESNS